MSKHNAVGPIGIAAPGRETLEAAVERAAHYLPIQGPIGVFIHHNTLHAFQHLPFEEAVQAGARRFGTEPFLLESVYRAELARGRILGEDLDAAVAAEPDAPLWPGGPARRRLRRLMLAPGPRAVTAANVDWLLREGGLLGGPRDRALFEVCLSRTSAGGSAASAVPARPRDALLAAAGVDIDEAVNARLIRDCSAFLDQGTASWPMPGREAGFYAAAAALAERAFALEPGPLSGLGDAFRRQSGLAPSAVVLACLNDFRVPVGQWESVLTAELLSLPGWAGLMHKLEGEPALAPHERLPCSLMDFLAVRLTLTRVAVENAWAARREARPFWTHWREAAAPAAPSEADRKASAARLFEAARLLGRSADSVEALSDSDLASLRAEVEAFGDWERRRLWHLAYERRHEQEILRPLAGHRSGIDPRRPAGRPFAQVVTCLDEREESFRRALEEHEPAVETLGAAGFFSVAVQYQGLDDPHGAALCPVVVTPRHAVTERPRAHALPVAALRGERRRLWAAAAHALDAGSRTLLLGWLFALLAGLPLLLPMLGRTVAPRLTARARARLARGFTPAPDTELALHRPDEGAVHGEDGFLPGFTVAEQAERIAGLLRAAGLTDGFARLVTLLGHGSTSLNNPHESAHDCGACGGRRGAPNARIAAAMANDSRVRERMAGLGVRVPSDTWFVGGYHDTCSDEVSLFDTDAVPATHAAEFERLRRALDAGRAANAHERARRFEAADDDDSADEALRHVEDRAARLSEPRPEYGHATNAVAVVGRRSLTRGLFLDRRAFLVSYDPDRDPSLDSLAALLGAGGPVCAGINLEYYFSVVDNERYGCGTKLPHNVTGLVGVMNGPASDLRTGLPWQMVEVHEPVRLLVIVENTPERVLEAAKRSPAVVELVTNGWIRLATIDPADGTVRVLRGGAFEPLQSAAEPPTVLSSVDWYRGKLEHLPIARIASTVPHPVVEGGKA